MTVLNQPIAAFLIQQEISQAPEFQVASFLLSGDMTSEKRVRATP